MPFIGITIGLVGLALGILSLVLYWRRTHDRQLWERLWLSRGSLSPSEYVLNRLGFAIALVGAILIWADVVAMVYYHR
jgi:hypothetical protein